MATIMYLHGSDGNLDDLFGHIQEMRRHLPVNILLKSYRGYGYSEGTPSMKGIHLDSQSALDHLTTIPQVDATKIIVYGHSLGGSVAFHLVADNWRRVKALVVENAFLSVPKMASHVSRYLAWASFVVTEVWDTEKQIEKLTVDAEANMAAPFTDILLITGTRDNQVPPHHGDGLWQKLQEIKETRRDVIIERGVASLMIVITIVSRSRVTLIRLLNFIVILQVLD